MGDDLNISADRWVMIDVDQTQGTKTNIKKQQREFSVKKLFKVDLKLRCSLKSSRKKINQIPILRFV